MTRRSRTLGLVLAALLIGVTWWSLRRETTPATMADPRQTHPALSPAGTLATARPETPLRQSWEASNPAARRDPRLAKLSDLMSQAHPRGEISRPALEAFLKKRGRSAHSLLAVWQESGDDAYLREALEAAPNDPTVLLSAVLSPALAEDHAALLARLKESDPDNPLPSWLAAAQQIASGNSGAAFAELLAAEGRNAFDNHQLALVDERRAMYEAAGFDPLRAEIEAQFGLQLKYLGPVKTTQRVVIDALPELRARGENDLAQDLAVTALNLGRSMSGERSLLIEQIAGLSLEKSALSSLGESAGGILGGATNASRLAEIDQRMQEIREVLNYNSYLESASYEQFVEYIRRMRADGEMTAMRWLAAERAPR